MSSTEEDILLEKMSTKICQLTRVVYLLNNKYLDAQSNIEAIKDTYDTELTSIVRQSNDYSLKLKEKIKNLEKNTNIENDFNKFKDEVEKKYLKEKKEKEDFYNDEINKLKKDHSDKLIEYKTSYEESIRLMKEELDNIKKNYLNKFDEIKKNHQKIVKDLSEERDKLNKTIEEIKLAHLFQNYPRKDLSGAHSPESAIESSNNFSSNVRRTTSRTKEILNDRDFLINFMNDDTMPILPKNMHLLTDDDTNLNIEDKTKFLKLADLLLDDKETVKESFFINTVEEKMILKLYTALSRKSKDIFMEENKDNKDINKKRILLHKLNNIEIPRFYIEDKDNINNININISENQGLNLNLNFNEEKNDDFDDNEN